MIHQFSKGDTLSVTDDSGQAGRAYGDILYEGQFVTVEEAFIDDDTPWVTLVGLSRCHASHTKFDRAWLAERFELAAPAPAPLDPSKVKAGDTVTLERGGGRLPDQEVVVVTATEQGWIILILKGAVEVRVTGPDPWLITDHTPAPEPEPEWKPGTVGTAGTVRGLGYTGPVVRTDENPTPWWTATRVGGAHWHTDGDVTDFRPDEAKTPGLVVIDPATVDVDSIVNDLAGVLDKRTIVEFVLERLGLAK